MPRRRTGSLTVQVNFATLILTAVLVTPAVISLIMMLVYANSYRQSVSRMETVALLKPLVSEEIPEQVWSAVAGRSRFEDCGVYDTLTEVESALDGLRLGDGDDGRLELDVARRTMNTLKSYIAQIETNLRDRVPVVESEHTLEEVRDVASLVDSMLEAYITREIADAAVTNALLSRLVIIFAVIEVALLIAALCFAGYTRKKLARSIHEPIERLEHFAGLMADGNLEARVPHTNVTELEDLTERVNVMAGRVQELIAQNRQEQENLKKSELRILQAQINPHFLYNTLDAIIWQAESGQSDEVVHITRALSDFFRISLSSGEDWIPVSQEIKHLRGYLSIQKTRYRDILNYELDMPENLDDCYMLKLLLQPLVENALYHGIKYKRGGGVITVAGRVEGERLFFSVRDTGKGMTPEELKDVCARMTGEMPPTSRPYASSGSGFGLNNIDQRIRLYYGQAEGLSIESGSEGTTVRFDVPCKRKEDVVNA